MLHAPVLLRPFATGFALVLGLLAAWIMAAELSRPSQGRIPANAVEAKAMALQNSAAATAAWIGWRDCECRLDRRHERQQSRSPGRSCERRRRDCRKARTFGCTLLAFAGHERASGIERPEDFNAFENVLLHIAV
jgi:hypothetical protein